MGKVLMVDVNGSHVLTCYVVFFLFISLLEILPSQRSL